MAAGQSGSTLEKYTNRQKQDQPRLLSPAGEHWYTGDVSCMIPRRKEYSSTDAWTFTLALIFVKYSFWWHLLVHKRRGHSLLDLA
ncbi:hypothetical protein V5799_023394 [Amblyomma americanum]|uniref:Uncharacterized protein n=1 Tax=Amblyomma americanum TaxID=6943 RepID=A0AAQ4FJT3_AMBAM